MTNTGMKKTSDEMLDWIEKHQPIAYENGVLSYFGSVKDKLLAEKYGPCHHEMLVSGKSLRDCVQKAMEER